MNENRIYVSSKYDDFVIKDENRNVDEKHINEIAKSMSENGWIGSPIEVSEDRNKYIIEEGQHRYVAAKRTHTPIKFIIVKSRNIFEIARQNSMVKKWTPYDYVDAYAKAGITSYKYLKTLINDFPGIKITTIRNMISTTNSSNDCFKKGLLKISSDMYIQGRQKIEDLSRVIEALGEYKCIGYERAFAVLIKKDLIDVEQMIEKIVKYKNLILVNNPSPSNAIDYIERLYNYHQRKITYLGDQYKKATRETTYV